MDTIFNFTVPADDVEHPEEATKAESYQLAKKAFSEIGLLVDNIKVLKSENLVYDAEQKLWRMHWEVDAPIQKLEVHNAIQEHLKIGAQKMQHPGNESVDSILQQIIHDITLFVRRTAFTF